MLSLECENLEKKIREESRAKAKGKVTEIEKRKNNKQVAFALANQFVQIQKVGQLLQAGCKFFFLRSCFACSLFFLTND